MTVSFPLVPEAVHEQVHQDQMLRVAASVVADEAKESHRQTYPVRVVVVEAAKA